MKKTVRNFAIILMIAIITLFSLTIVSNAASGSAPGSGQSSADIINGLMSPNGTPAVGGITNVGANIVSIITTIGIIVALIVLLILGIKYMMGSASEKAEYKKTMIPYLVGAVLIFGASAIAKAVIAMTESITA